MINVIKRLTRIGLDTSLSKRDQARVRFILLDAYIIVFSTLLFWLCLFLNGTSLSLDSVSISIFSILTSFLAIFYGYKQRYYIVSWSLSITLLIVVTFAYHWFGKHPDFPLFFLSVIAVPIFYFFQKRWHLILVISVYVSVFSVIRLFDLSASISTFNGDSSILTIMLYFGGIFTFFYRLFVVYILHNLALEDYEQERGRYKDLFDNNPIGLISSLPEQEVNDTFCEMLGYNRTELLSKKYEIIAEKDRRRILEQIEKLKSGEQSSFVEEIEYIREDTSKLYCKVHSRAVYDKEGNCFNYLSSVIDITERKIAENQLREREQLLEKVINNIPFSVFWKDRESRYLGCNTPFANYTELLEADVIGKKDYEMPWHAEAENYVSIDQMVIKSGIPQKNIIEKFFPADGKLCWARTSKVPLLDGEGNVFGVLGIFEDITKQRAQKLQLEETSRILKESEDKYRNVFENAYQAIIIIDMKTWKFVDCNHHAPEMFGCASKEEFLNSPLEIFNVGGDRSTNTKKGISTETFRQIIPLQGENISYEYFYNRLDGSRFDVEVNIVKDVSEGKQQLITFISDISDRKLKEKELLEAKEKAEQSNRFQSTFLANMSHEIRTPMNGIVGFSNMLLEPKVEQKEKQEYASIINNCCKQLLKIVNEVLDMSKIQTGSLKVNKATVELNSLLKEVRDIFLIPAKDKDLYINIEMRSSATHVYTDVDKLRQIIVNFVSNAIKFTHSGGVTIGYEVKLGQVHIQVRDTGAGIPNDKQAQVFERFKRIGDTSIRGAGLGLAICQGFAKVIDGKIKLQSKLDEGSIFSISIPHRIVVSETKNRTRTTKEPQLNIRNIEKLKGKKVLIAEDEKFNYKLLSTLLAKYDIEVMWAQDGKKAVQLFQEHRHELSMILMDMKMPIMNGMDATKIIKMQHDIPIVAQSAQAFQEEREAIIAGGCDDHIAKPIDRNRLLEVLLKYIE